MIEGIKSISSGFEFLKITDITGKGFEYKIIFVILVLTEMCSHVSIFGCYRFQNAILYT